MCRREMSPSPTSNLTQGQTPQGRQGKGEGTEAPVLKTFQLLDQVCAFTTARFASCPVDTALPKTSFKM